jgi:hypothetical protein
VKDRPIERHGAGNFLPPNEFGNKRGKGRMFKGESDA